MKFIKYLAYFAIFFVLFYLENFKVSETLTFSQFWKIPLIVLLFSVIALYKNIKRPAFNRFAYLYAFKNLFNQGFFTAPITNLVETFRYSSLPLLNDTLGLFFKSSFGLHAFIVRIAQNFILSSIPFLVGVLKSPAQGLVYGDEESFVGLFQNPHSSSIITCFSILILIHHLRSSQLVRVTKLFNMVLVGVGIFILYKAFVRTGYLMFLVGLVILYFPANLNFKQWFTSMLAFSILTIGIYQFFQNEERFRQRILDQNAEGVAMDFGSGRLVFAAISLQFWLEGNWHQMLLGRGLEEVKDNLQKKTGMRIFSHNGIVDSLVINGLIGLLLFISMLFFMLAEIRKHRSSKYYRLSLAMFVSYIIFQFTQGGTLFPSDLLMASVLNLVAKKPDLNV